MKSRKRREADGTVKRKKNVEKANRKGKNPTKKKHQTNDKTSSLVIKASKRIQSERNTHTKKTRRFQR